MSETITYPQECLINEAQANTRWGIVRRISVETGRVVS